MMDFIRFAESHGLRIDSLEHGRWMRTKTEDKPRKRNGSYKFLGEVGFVQNHATMAEVAVWHADKENAKDPGFERRMAEARAEATRILKADRERASEEAKNLIAASVSGPHPYLAGKGFPNAQGLVHSCGDLIIPMRDFDDYAKVNSAQRIRPDGFKLFLKGGQAGNSVFILGRGQRAERWLVEGYATGLSVFAALTELHRPAEVVVCFSAENLKRIAGKVRRPAFVMADNDLPDRNGRKAGQDAATATGLPWGMPQAPGADANDLHASKGLRALVALVRTVSNG